MAEISRTTPASTVRAPATFGLYFRLTVTNAAATLVSLLPNATLPQIPHPTIPNRFYQFGFVDLWSETDPASVKVRVTDDGQTAPTATLGRVVPFEPAILRLPCDPNDVKLISAGAGVNVQCYLGIAGIG